MTEELPPLAMSMLRHAENEDNLFAGLKNRNEVMEYAHAATWLYFLGLIDHNHKITDKGREKLKP